VLFVKLDHFIALFLAFIMLGLVYSVSSQQIGWEERLRNDLFCVKWDVKHWLNQFPYLRISLLLLQAISRIAVTFFAHGIPLGIKPRFRGIAVLRSSDKTTG